MGLREWFATKIAAPTNNLDRHFAFNRPDLQGVLVEYLSGLGVETQLEFRVARLECVAGKLWLADDSCVTGDLIACADGEKSPCSSFRPVLN